MKDYLVLEDQQAKASIHRFKMSFMTYIARMATASARRNDSPQDAHTVLCVATPLTDGLAKSDGKIGFSSITSRGRLPL